jgi:hypothetical protein
VFKWIEALWKNNIVQEIPDEIACCEFLCRELECSHKRWETCPNRIEYADRLKNSQSAIDPSGEAKKTKSSTRAA